jgi:hypothetical protein
MPTNLPPTPPPLLIATQGLLRSMWGLAQIIAAGKLTRIGQACFRLGLSPVGRLLVELSVRWLDRLDQKLTERLARLPPSVRSAMHPPSPHVR